MFLLLGRRETLHGPRRDPPGLKKKPLPIDDRAEAQSLGALGDEPQNLLLLPPEWVGLAPVLQRFRRRRRNARRRLTDPDYPTQSLDETEEFP